MEVLDCIAFSFGECFVGMIRINIVIENYKYDLCLIFFNVFIYGNPTNLIGIPIDIQNLNDWRFRVIAPYLV